MRQEGFVLVMTIWIVAIIAVIAAYFSGQVDKSTELARQMQNQTRELIDLAGTKAEILYRLGVTPISVYGLGTTQQDSIALDDSPYKGKGDTIARLQDDRGLLNLNIVDDARLERFLTTLGVPGDQIGTMSDTLRDYTDPDSLKRLNGAEKDDYAKLGLPPPRNANLTTPYEAKNIIAWKDKPQLWRNGLLPNLTTTSLSVAMNPNTAPWQVLTSLPGINYQVAESIIKMRKIAPIFDPSQIAVITGINPQLLAFSIIAFPANIIRVTLYSPSMPWGWQFNVSLSPNDATSPWRIDYFYKIELAYENHDQEVPLPLPPTPALPATAAVF